MASTSLINTYTNHLVEAGGVPVKVIQEILGHSSINTTLGIYPCVSKKYFKGNIAL